MRLNTPLAAYFSSLAEIVPDENIALNEVFRVLALDRAEDIGRIGTNG
jgi:hypothetical protein